MRELFLAATLLAGSALPALAAGADFKLINSTGAQIDEVYLGPVSSDSWGKDVMGTAPLADSESVTITVAPPANACQWDMRVKYHGGDNAEWHNLNLCDIKQITLFRDTANNTTRAVTE